MAAAVCSAWGQTGDSAASWVQQLGHIALSCRYAAPMIARASHHPIPASSPDRASLRKALCKLPNVGPATADDLLLLGYDTPQSLCAGDPDEMYRRLCSLTGVRHDPCAWDVFAAVVHNARTGESRKWWDFTSVRRARPDCVDLSR